MKYIIYLLTLTSPQKKVVFVAEGDSVFFYHNTYHKEKVVYHEPNIYVFDSGSIVRQPVNLFLVLP